MREFIVNPGQSANQFTRNSGDATRKESNMHRFVTHEADPGSKGTTDGDLLRLCTEVQTLVRGASADAMKQLGADTLVRIKKVLTAEVQGNSCSDLELLQLASEVKGRISTPLNVADLSRLGKRRLLELSGRDYNLNSFLVDQFHMGQADT
ncbi:MAG: hypothetical protein KIT35_09375 [Piscinibacter sp.]|uniref:hypothetical protein n=1 Tax=Piscinibacter sp. TaxID=1903157 RepID=UPI002590A777|nr:hypothetical protein [Piscinibacter sp.]MCW5664032.1 hypothetical protein [Piscinibacter sp.]